MKRSFSPLLLAPLAAVSFAPTFAADQNWTAGDGDFLDGANWSPGFVGEWPVADNAQISNGGTATLSGGTVTLAELRVGQSGQGTEIGHMAQSGGTLTLNVGLVVGRQGAAVGTYTMTGGSLFLPNLRVGGGPVGTTAQGTMTVSGAETLVTTAGTGHTGIGTTGTGVVTLSSGAQWIHNGANAFLVGADNSVAGANGGTGTLNVDSGASLLLAGTSALAIGRNNTGNGTVAVNGGSITLAGPSALINLGGTNGSVTGGTAVLTINSGSVTGSSVRIWEGSGTVNLNGGTLTTGSIIKHTTNLSAKVNFNGGTVRASAGSGNFFNGFAASELEIQAGGLVFDTNGMNVTFLQGFSGAGAFTKTGDGLLVVSGTSTYAGGTLIDEGFVIVTAGNLGLGTITVAAGGSLDFDYDFALATGGLVLLTGSEFILDQNLSFAGLTIAGDVFEEGVYSYAELEAQYGDIFTDSGSGQITVTAIPEPSALALLGLGATAVLWRFRRPR